MTVDVTGIDESDVRLPDTVITEDYCTTALPNISGKKKVVVCMHIAYTFSILLCSKQYCLLDRRVRPWISVCRN